MRYSTRLSYMHGPAPGSKPFQRILLILFVSFALGGLLFTVIGGIWMHSDIAFYKTAKTAQGEIAEFVSDSEGGQHPIVRYTVDGKEYRVRLNSYSSSMRVGDVYTMYYAPDAPHQARNKTFLGSTMFLCIGGCFFLFGAVGLGISTMRRNGKQRLIEKGDAVTARITAVACAENVTVNGRTPYYLFCETSAVPALAGKRLKSRYIYEPLPQSLVGTSVRVYFDPQKPTKYLVDTDSLQKRDNFRGFSV